MKLALAPSRDTSGKCVMGWQDFVPQEEKKGLRIFVAYGYEGTEGGQWQFASYTHTLNVLQKGTKMLSGKVKNTPRLGVLSLRAVTTENEDPFLFSFLDIPLISRLIWPSIKEEQDFIAFLVAYELPLSCLYLQAPDFWERKGIH